MSSQQSSQRIEIIQDPSIQDGEKVKEMIFPLILPDTEEPIESKIRFFTLMEDDNLTSFRIEITSDVNVFFVYQASFTEENFAEFKEKEQFEIDFVDFPSVLQEMLHSKEYSVLFKFEEESKAILAFQQKLKFKVVEIFSINFQPAPLDLVQQIVQYRFYQLKASTKALKSQLDDIYAMLKIKDPSMLRKMTSSIRK